MKGKNNLKDYFIQLEKERDLEIELDKNIKEGNKKEILNILVDVPDEYILQTIY